MPLSILYANPGLPVTYTLDSDPTIFTGWRTTNAELNSLLLRLDNNTIYYKSGNTQTAWTLLSPSSGLGLFGSGSDLVLDFDGINPVAGYAGPVLVGGRQVYTPTRSAYATDAFVRNGVDLDQRTWPGPYVKGTLDFLNGNGRILWNGTNAAGTVGGTNTGTGPMPVGTGGGTGGAANTPGGAGGASNLAPRIFATAGAPGGVGGAPPTNPTAGGLGHGGGGGASLANGGQGGAVTTVPVSNGDWETPEAAATGVLIGGGAIVEMTGPSGGGGGAGGGGVGVGGGAGAGACWGYLPVKRFANCSAVNFLARGGDGANAVAASGANQPGGGGGGSGAGGVIVVCTADAVSPINAADAATVCPAGAIGLGSVGTGTGSPGTNGAPGGIGAIRVFN